MPVNVALGHVSNDFLIAALVIYSLSVVAFAGDFAYGRPRRAASASPGPATPGRAASLAAWGVTAATSGMEAPTDGPGGAAGPGAAAPGGPPAVPDSMPEVAVPPRRAIAQAGRWVQAAMALAVVGVVAHTIAVVTRGLAVHRAPWGNMY